MSDSLTVSRHADVIAVLSDTAFEVPPVLPPTDSEIDMGWLRGQVSRFATGDAHTRRLGLVGALLDAVDPAQLRRAASDRTAVALATGESRATIARTVPVAALAEALGVVEPVVKHVRTVARGYLADTDAGPVGDVAVRALVAACGGIADESTAARIAVLVQACDATAELIDHTLAAADRSDTSAAVERVIAETLRYDPPVRIMRRVCVQPATVRGEPVVARTDVVLDVAAANRDAGVFTDPDTFDPDRDDVHRHLTFGAGLRPCPGREHAVALAGGVVSAVLASVGMVA